MNKKIMFMAFLTPLVAFSEINLQKEIYDAAEEMMKFDEKMNQIIAEHNNIAYDGDEDLEFSNVSIDDFREVVNGYELRKDINDTNVKVKVKTKDSLLTISLLTKEVKELVYEGETGTETIMSSSSIALPIPNDADENKLISTYSDGILIIKLPKK
ncbi:MAG: Unknown protein [uncultured Sulfurovum sp.]|uniref:SHSP domain-containing protein n=1 Tax=uncultured Sulfurovum sp. TaxID=269237 RepID=A0A6S6SE24_9BACT|nr:MAG: Unknown protein [uncultured Sulfurovum sp.]